MFNVLVGHMSFVGPRPDVHGYADMLESDDRVILSVRPGIRGPATLKYRDQRTSQTDSGATFGTVSSTDTDTSMNNLIPAHELKRLVGQHKATEHLWDRLLAGWPGGERTARDIDEQLEAERRSWKSRE